VAPTARAQPAAGSRLAELEAERDALASQVERRHAQVDGLDERARALRDERRTAEARLQEIEAELSLAVERYNEAVVVHEQVQAERARTQAELDELSQEVATTQARVIDHARRLHKLGPSVEFSLLLAGDDPADVGFRSTSLRMIIGSEQVGVEALEAATARTSALEARLVEQEATAAVAAARVEAELVEVEASYARHETELAALAATLAQVRAVEAAERSALDADESALQTREDELAEERARLEAARERERRTAQQAVRRTPSTPTTTPTPQQPARPSAEPRRSAQVAVDTALAQVGKPYRWGGTGPNAFDCSGLTSYAWRAAGVTIPRTSRAQFGGLTRISRGALQPGDLVFYNSPISHVALYAGGDTIVEASRAGVPVRTARLSARSPVGYARP